MTEYRAMLKNLADTESDEVIASKTASHAGMIIAQLFARASRSVDLLVQRPFDGMFDSQVETAACAFVKKSATRMRLIHPAGLMHNSLTDFREATSCYGAVKEERFEVFECAIPKFL